MDTKLTLSINANIIEKAKKAIQSGNQSLSGLVEDYFRELIKTKDQKKPFSPIVKELSGLAKKVKKSEEETIYDYLLGKYK